MKSVILLLAVFISGCSFESTQCHYKTVAVEVGSCGGGEGYFSGNRECSISYELVGNDGIMFGSVYRGAMSGQTLYMSCFEDGKKCFSVQSVKPKAGYKKECPNN